MARLLLLCLALSSALAAVHDVATMVHTLFLLKDTDRNGSLTSAEIRGYFAGCDRSKDGRLSEAEFYHCSVEKNRDIHHFAKTLFKAFDVAHNHVITISDAGTDVIVHAMDQNDDGEVSSHEFSAYIHKILKNAGHH